MEISVCTTIRKNLKNKKKPGDLEIDAYFPVFVFGGEKSEAQQKG